MRLHFRHKWEHKPLSGITKNTDFLDAEDYGKEHCTGCDKTRYNRGLARLAWTFIGIEKMNNENLTDKPVEFCGEP